MKDKILYLILGILIGAIITAGVFLVVNKNSKPDFEKGGKMNGDFQNMVNDGTMPDRGEMRKSSNEVDASSNDQSQVSEETTSNNV